MRILGGLRNWHKLVFLTFAFFGVSLTTGANEALVVKSHAELLKLSKVKGTEFKKLRAQFEIDDLSANSLVSLYNWVLSGGASTQDAENPQTSPFAPAGETSRQNYSVRLDKKSAMGVDPYVELSSADQKLSFPGRGNIEFQVATLETGLRLDLMKLFYAKKSSEVFKQAKAQKEIAKLSQLNFERTFEAELSKAYFQALKSFKKLEILQNECAEYKKLSKISSSRYRRRLIREKDYLSIEVLSEGCLLDKDFAKNTHEMNKISLLKMAGLPLDTRITFNNQNFLNQQNIEFKITNNLDYKIAKKIMESTSAESMSKKSNRLPEISLDYSLTSQASEEGVGASISEVFGYDLITQNIGFNLSYEFGESATQIEAKRASALAHLRSLEFTELESSLIRDQKILHEQNEFLIKAVMKSDKLVRLQKRKSELFRRDFENGKGSIRDLVDAQINYLKSLESALDFKYSRSVSDVDLMYISGGGGFEEFN